MARKRSPTVREKAEIVNVFHGINPRTLQVESVYVTRDGHMTKHGPNMAMHTHYNAHGNPPNVEIGIVYGLIDMFEVHPQFENKEHTREQLDKLKTKAERMRAEKEAQEKSTASRKTERDGGSGQTT